MNTPDFRCSLTLIALALLCSAPAIPAAPASATKSAAAPGRATAAPPPALEMEIPQSVFAIPASAKEGRNPFFPRSIQGLDAPKTKPNPLDTSSILLNGIVPSGPRRTAMINGRTFEKGEESEIKLPAGGKVLVKCEDIREDSVVVLVNGTVRRELRLRTGLQ